MFLKKVRRPHGTADFFAHLGHLKGNIEGERTRSRLFLKQDGVVPKIG